MNKTKRLLISMLTLLFCCTGMWAVGELNGVFTISASGGKVQFSQGNLQYQASTNTWRFATNQYDYIGNAAGNTSPSSTQTAWIDYFNWGTSGYNHGANCYQPWSTSTIKSDYYAYGSSSKNLYDAKDDNSMRGQADWGYNAISNGGNTENSGWRVLTKDEWAYLISSRSETYRYAKGTIHGTNGLMLFPDGFTLPTGVSISNANTTDASYTSYGDDTWTALEAAGVVFLPATGLRNGTSVEETGTVGNYWSSTCMNADRVYNIRFDGSSLNLGNDGDRQNGFPVRLVKSYLKQDGEGYYLIGSVDDWKAFADIVKTTPNANAKMTADVDLGTGNNTRIGDIRQDISTGVFYQGEFDGQGHTLTIHYNVMNDDGVPAPFTHISGATIKNLHVAGTITTNMHHSSVVAHVRGGTNLVSNIWSSLNITTSKNSWDECSAIVSWMGHATLTIQDCLFTGSITGTNGSDYNGCFIGWHQHDEIPQIKNCLSTGTFTTTTSNWDATRGATCTNCYIKQFPTAIPTDMQVTDAQLSDGTTAAALGSAWVQDADTGEPRLDLFMATTSLTANEGKTGEYWSTYYDGAKSSIADANTTVYTGKVSGDKIALTEVTDKTIPAGNAVILKSTAANVTLTKTSATGTLANNDLKGVDVATAKTNVYCLNKNGTVVGFYKYTGDVPAHRAYIESISSARMFSLGDGDATGIVSMEEGRGIKENGTDEWYSLDGRQLNAQPTRKGVYVKDGKKVVIK